MGETLVAERLARLALCHLGLALPVWDPAAPQILSDLVNFRFRFQVAEVLGRFQRLEPPDQARIKPAAESHRVRRKSSAQALFLQQACASGTWHHAVSQPSAG